ncbi:hypothetical protein K523DRAFT_167965 [Schizophyllum commune Tattone D]|nr:hypothetical protein K523DRAFT_167965 [Schizophyllum commune Tattone D]
MQRTIDDHKKTALDEPAYREIMRAALGDNWDATPTSSRESERSANTLDRSPGTTRKLASHAASATGVSVQGVGGCESIQRRSRTLGSHPRDDEDNAP